MNNAKKLIIIMLQYWKLMISGLLTMSMFAFLSGISITMAVPLFDYVFGSKHINSTYNNLGSFLNEFLLIFTNFFQNIELNKFFAINSYIMLIDEMKNILSLTNPHIILLFISISVIILIVFKNTFFYLNRVIFVTLRGKVTQRLRDLLFQKYLSLPISFFHKNSIGDTQVRITSDVNIVSDLFIKTIFGSLRDVSLMIVYTSMALFINYKLFFYTILIIPIFSIAISFLGKKIKKYSKRIQQTYSVLYSKIEEVSNGIKIVKSFSKEEHELTKFVNENIKFFKAWLKTQLYQAINTPLSEITSAITGAIVLFIGGKMVLDNPDNFSFGSFTAFLFALFSILHPMKNITKAYTNIKKAFVSLDRVFFILNKTPDIEDSLESIEFLEFKDGIHFSNISFSYDGKNDVLKHVDLYINKGEKIALVGSSGSGKSTLVNLLERFYDVDSGEILIDGVNIKNIKLRALHNLFGTVTQDSILFNETIENNLRYGTNKNILLEEVIKASETAYAHSFIKELPNTYSTMLDPKGTNLSGGQKQRLCIARAIVGDPPILIFDEATSALDSESEQFVQKAIEKATQNRTVLVIAHRLSTILNSDKIIVMDKGEIIDIGTHENLLTKSKKYKMLYDIQFNNKSNLVE